MQRLFWGLVLTSAMTPVSIAAVVGHMTAAEPITEARIATLPKAEQPVWLAYLAHSRALMDADKAALAAERAQGAYSDPEEPTHASGAGMALDRPDAWYSSAEARHVADNIVSFQTPAGGWGKNVDRSGPLRVRGQGYVPIEHLPDYAKTDIQASPNWNYVGTIDNNATTTELRFLARVQAQLPGAAGAPYRAALLKGVRYLLTAQFPNGGWPQVYPLQGGYHDTLTYNDDALADVVRVLNDVSSQKDDYGFVPQDLAAQTRVAEARAIHVILATQVKVNGVLTGWGQQHDALTLEPAGARNFEPASLASYESAKLLDFLMRLPHPSAQVVAAVDAGVAWLKRSEIRDVEWVRAAGPEGRHLVAKPGAGPIWSRYYDLRTLKPVFGDRDKSIHDDANELSLERRNGYSWYGDGPAKTIEAYARWAPQHRS